MAEERVRRILSHATCQENGDKPCESNSQGRVVTDEMSIPGSDTRASQWEQGWWLRDAVTSSGEEVKIDAGLGELKSDLAIEESLMDSQQATDLSDLRKHEAGAVPGSLSSSSRGMGSATRPHEAGWPMADDCIFCKIVHGYAPAFKLYEDDFCVCILDINPLCYGHALLVPKGHFPALHATPAPVAAAMCSVVPLLSSVLMEATSCDSFNMVVNNGEAAGQVVFHTHFHIIPRFSGDGLWTNESVSRKSLTTFNDPVQLTHAVRSKLRNKT